jgi:hypothetical protein
MNTQIAFDPGFGNIKLYGEEGPLLMQSAVGISGGPILSRMTGLRGTRPPLRVQTGAGVFFVGEGAHDWGRPVENLDFDRLTGAPEMMALFYGSLTKYGIPVEPCDLIVGLPIHALAGDDASRTKRAIRTALLGKHTWLADAQECGLQVDEVRLTSQPVGAMFDYLLDKDGQMSAIRQTALKAELGILGIGMNTVDLLVVRDGSPVSRFTAGDTLGVRRLLAVHRGTSDYSLAELDMLLRQRVLELDGATQVWQSEVVGFIEKHWGSTFRRFRAVIAVGGGVVLLREALLRRFRDKLHIPDDPVIATARGLYKYAQMVARRQRV